MNVAALRKLLAKVPDDLEVEIHLDLLDDEDPVVGNVKSTSIALSVEKENVFIIEAVDAHPEGEEDEEEADEDEEEEEGDDDDDNEEEGEGEA